ncbi:hypothetical protein A3D03_05060 [Candidatus Gottesmanbacteria bacterium RIFCSPHIGHO2_02_FULL_40_13]|uniref:Uncharacterized protein n=1 Tax=Candidatus Gottesmanbacteria bacterium RIFCSPHIGHO2_02_FULL_40_13 TaxID=1798384 RepID=A0A1F6ADN1_9BACT|nr:MAG: hypothetical protein A3D03_05060 [Candidatus Gottesmanbacteria bacterium RIFCSPHIGHO2_02_FULL_40_13]
MKNEINQHKSKLPFRFTKILIIISITIVMIVISLSLTNHLFSGLRGAFWKAVPEYSDLSEHQIITDRHVLGYQIASDGNEVIFLTGTETHQDIYSWNSNSGITKKLNSTPILSDSISFNNTNLRAISVAFVDQEKNIYFESGIHLIKIDPMHKVTAYDYLPNLLYTSEELTTKAISNLNKKIIEKYSKEPIVALKKYESSVIAYLIEIDGKYYYDQYDTALNPAKYTLSRFAVEGETVENIESNENRVVEYDGLWDFAMQTVNPRGKISRIVETVTINPEIIIGNKVKYPKIPHLLDQSKKYEIDNNFYKAFIQHVCYKELLPIDNTCRAWRTLLNIKSREYILPNFEVIYGGVLLNEPKDTAFIYVPYDNRFFTANGKFIFLSLDNKLFAL